MALRIAFGEQRSALFALGCLLIGAPLQAQQHAVLSGAVIDRSTGNGIANAQVILFAIGRFVVADSSGKFLLQDPPIGISRVTVRAIGFPPRQLEVEVASGQRTDQTIQLDSTAFGRLHGAPTELPTVGVSAAAPVVNYRLSDFERRRLTGRGQYLTEDDIVKSGAYNLADALKNMRGVEFNCEGSGCHVRMFRAPMRCLPEYIVDGRVMNDFGPSTPIRDIVGLEVYTGPSDVPGEYAGTYAGCGVVVIWTRSGPPRRR